MRRGSSTMNYAGQAWTEQDVSWLQDELAKRLGYLIVDWSRPSRREGERIAVNIHRETCRKLRPANRQLVPPDSPS
jgi:hypothetical protein